MTCVVADDADLRGLRLRQEPELMNHMQEGTINLARRRLLKE